MNDLETAQERLFEGLQKGTKVTNREKLGATVPIQLFQALRLVGMGTAIEGMIGTRSRALVYQSGVTLGRELGKGAAEAANGDLNKFVEAVQQLLVTLSIGHLVIEKVDMDNGQIQLRVDECVSCAGISGAKQPICNFEGGLVAGVLSTFLNKKVKATETRCNACGDPTCGFDVEVL